MERKIVLPSHMRHIYRPPKETSTSSCSQLARKPHIALWVTLRFISRRPPPPSSPQGGIRQQHQQKIKESDGPAHKTPHRAAPHQKQPAPGTRGRKKMLSDPTASVLKTPAMTVCSKKVLHVSSPAPVRVCAADAPCVATACMRSGTARGSLLDACVGILVVW